MNRSSGIITSEQDLISMAKNGNNKALEIIRNRNIIKTYTEKIEKLESQFPNILKFHTALDFEQTKTDIFHYGKVTAYKEIVELLKQIEQNTLLEAVQE